MRSSSRFGLLVPSLLILAAALALWSARRSRSERIQAESDQRAVQLKGAHQADAQLAYSQSEQAEHNSEVAQTLRRTHQADARLTYSALSTVEAMYGARPMKGTARVVRAPRKMSITYLSGDAKGMQSGFNERWFWRQNGGARMEAYAEVELRPDEMATRRFALLMKNYRGAAVCPDKVDGRTADVIELRPIHKIEGASGPFKRLWLDRETGLTLRVDAFNYKSQPVMRSVLSQVDFSPHVQNDTFVPPAAMAKAAKIKPWRAEELGEHREKVAAEAHVLPPQPSYLPPGFAFDSVGVHRSDAPGSPPLAALSRYTDGLNVLTIYAMKRPTPAAKTSDAAPPSQAHDYGPGTMAMRETATGTLMAVCDLPPAVLNRVLASARVELPKTKTHAAR